MTSGLVPYLNMQSKFLFSVQILYVSMGNGNQIYSQYLYTTCGGHTELQG